MYSPIRRFALVVLLLLSGCAAIPQNNDHSGADPPRYSGLYDGKSALTYGTAFPAGSAAEAVARGDAALQRGDLDRALFEYVQALEKNANDGETFYKIGSIHAARGNMALANIAYGYCLKHAPQHAGALEGLGLNLLELRQYKEARRQLEHALAADPKRWRAANGLGVIADLRGDYIGAQVNYRAALAIEPESAMVHNNLGYSIYLAGDLQAAAREFYAATRMDSRYERAWRNLALVYARLGWYENAISVFAHVEDTPSAYNDTGYICMLDGDYRNADRLFREAIRRSPAYYETAQRNLARNEALRSNQ